MESRQPGQAAPPEETPPPPPIVQIWRMKVDADEKFARRNVMQRQWMTEKVAAKLASSNQEKERLAEELQRRREEKLEAEDCDAFLLLRQKHKAFTKELHDATDYNQQLVQARREQEEEAQRREAERPFGSMTDYMNALRSQERSRYDLKVAQRQKATEERVGALERLRVEKEASLGEVDRQRGELGEARRLRAVFQDQHDAREQINQLARLKEFRKQQAKEKEEREKGVGERTEAQPMALQMYNLWEQQEKRRREGTVNNQRRTEMVKALMEREMAKEAQRAQEEEARKEALYHQHEMDYNQKLQEDTARTRAAQKAIAAHREQVHAEKEEMERAEREKIWFL